MELSNIKNTVKNVSWNFIIFLMACAIIGGVFFTFFSGCTTTPKPITDKDGNMVEVTACYYYRLCIFTAWKTGQPISSCDRQFDACNRMEIKKECDKCEDANDENNCWIKLKP